MSIQFDFLPKEYHEAHLRRRSISLLVVTLLFIFFLGIGGLLIQIQLNEQFRKTHQELSQIYYENQVKITQHQQEEAKQNLWKKKAELLIPVLAGYPRSWLIQTVFYSVPKDVVLDQISLSLKEERTSTMPQGERASGSPIEISGSEQPPQDELIARQKSLRNAWIDIVIDARTASAAAVQDFFARLSQYPVFEEVNLQTVEGSPEENTGQATTHFVIFARCRHLPVSSAFVHPRQAQPIAAKQSAYSPEFAKTNDSP